MHPLPSPAPGRRQMAAALLIGSVALLILGLQPILLGELVARHVTSMEGVGIIAMGEILALGVGVALGESLLPLRYYRNIAVFAAITTALLDAESSQAASEAALLAVRTLAGIAEGLLVWVATGVIVRSPKPDRLAAVFVVTQTLTQAGSAALLALLVIPGFGWQGGFLTLGALTLAAALLMPALPAGLSPLSTAYSGHLRWSKTAIAPLALAFAMMAAIGSLWAYLEPLGVGAGLNGTQAQTVVSLSLALQVLGGLTSVLLVRRLNAAKTLGAGGLALAVLALAIRLLPSGSATLFAVLSAAFGYCWLFLMPFQVAQALKIDANGRIATLIPAAQLVGSAFGPMVASFTVHGDEAGAVPLVCAGFSLLALTIALRGRRH